MVLKKIRGLTAGNSETVFEKVNDSTWKKKKKCNSQTGYRDARGRRKESCTYVWTILGAFLAKGSRCKDAQQHLQPSSGRARRRAAGWAGTGEPALPPGVVTSGATASSVTGPALPGASCLPCLYLAWSYQEIGWTKTPPGTMLCFQMFPRAKRDVEASCATSTSNGSLLWAVTVLCPSLSVHQL